MKKIGQLLDLIYYKSFDSGYTGSGNDQFWNGTSQVKMELTDTLYVLPLKFRIKRIDIIVEANVDFDHNHIIATFIGTTSIQNRRVYEDLLIEDVVDKLTTQDAGHMFLLDGMHMFSSLIWYPIVVDDQYQVHTYHTDIFVDASKDALHLDINYISHDATAVAATGDSQYVIIMGVEIL